MIKLSELKVIENAFFRANLLYIKPNLYSFLEKNFFEDKLFDNVSLEKIDKIINDTNNAIAQNYLLNKDFSQIKKYQKNRSEI